jgi:hypothetical protein
MAGKVWNQVRVRNVIDCSCPSDFFRSSSSCRSPWFFQIKLDEFLRHSETGNADVHRVETGWSQVWEWSTDGRYCWHSSDVSTAELSCTSPVKFSDFFFCSCWLAEHPFSWSSTLPSNSQLCHHNLFWAELSTMGWRRVFPLLEWTVVAFLHSPNLDKVLSVGGFFFFSIQQLCPFTAQSQSSTDRGCSNPSACVVI